MKKLFSCILCLFIPLLLVGCKPEPKWIVPGDRFVLRLNPLDIHVGGWLEQDGLRAKQYIFWKGYSDKIDMSTVELDISDDIIVNYLPIEDGAYIDDTVYEYGKNYFVYTFSKDKNFTGGYAFCIDLNFIWEENATSLTRTIPETISFILKFNYFGGTERITEMHTLDLTTVWDGY